MTEVRKVPPLSCPLCHSTRVVQLFGSRKGRAYLSSGKIVCYECEKKVDINTNENTRISIDEFEQKYLELAHQRRVENEKKEKKKYE